MIYSEFQVLVFPSTCSRKNVERVEFQVGTGSKLQYDQDVKYVVVIIDNVTTHVQIFYILHTHSITYTLYSLHILQAAALVS